MPTNRRARKPNIKSLGNKTHCDICNSKAARKARSKKEHITEEVVAVTAPSEAESTGDTVDGGQSDQTSSNPQTTQKEGITAHDRTKTTMMIPLSPDEMRCDCYQSR